MDYLIVAITGAVLATCVWFAWRRKRPLTLLRASLVLAILGVTGFVLWTVYDLEGAAEAAAQGFSNAAAFR